MVHLEFRPSLLLGVHRIVAKMKMKRTFSLILILLLSNAVYPQQYEVSVTTITVWVKASDKSGNAVRNLAAADFEIYEDNKKMESTCFEEIGTSKLVTQSKTAVEESSTISISTQPEASRRRMVLFVDLFNTSMSEYQSVRKTTDEFVSRIDPKEWDVMLAAIINTGKAGVVIPFGNDLKKISERIPLLQPNAQRDVAVMNRKRTISQLLKIDPSRIAEAYRLAASYANLEKHDSEESIFAFDQLAEYMQKIVADEHVVVVYISGGINLQPGRVYFEMVKNFVGEAATLNSAEFAFTYPSNREPNFDINRKIKQSIGRLNKKNITIYCLNTRGTANPADDNIHEDDRGFIVNDTTLLKDFQESLDQIADETGGISFRNSNNFTKGFTDILKDSEHQYILCYNTSENKDKGKYHDIKVVSLKPGIKLRYRKGYVN